MNAIGFSKEPVKKSKSKSTRGKINRFGIIDSDTLVNSTIILLGVSVVLLLLAVATVQKKNARLQAKVNKLEMTVGMGTDFRVRKVAYTNG